MKRIILMLMMATGVMTSLAITPIDSLELRRLQQMADSVVDEPAGCISMSIWLGTAPTN